MGWVEVFDGGENERMQVVGLVGEHYVGIEESVNEGDYVRGDNGIGTKGSEGRWKVMKIRCG